jgi:hypothetical protein
MRSLFVVFSTLLLVVSLCGSGICDDNAQKIQVAGPNMPMHPMMGVMGAKSAQMVATSDGGVVILSRNELSKYDKDLNLVKKVTVDIEQPDMGAAMYGPMMDMGGSGRYPGDEKQRR